MGKKCNDLVSVVMTVYDDKNFLQESIDSIISQTYSNWELIIVCEYMCDQTTLEIVKRMSEIDSRIMYVCNDRKLGFAESLNVGLNMANGKYIARMDADDVCYKNRLKHQVRFMNKYPELLLSGADIRFIDEKGKKGKRTNYCKNQHSIKTALIFGCEFAHPTIIYNREILLKSKMLYSSQYKTEDYELWSRLAYNYPVANMRKCVLKYRIHGNNSSLVDAEKVEESTRNVQNNILKSLGINIHLKFSLITGFESEEELSEFENEIKRFILKDKTKWSLYIFRKKMDDVYNNSQVKMQHRFGKSIRFWKKFKALYGKMWYVFASFDIVCSTIRRAFLAIKYRTISRIGGHL